MAKHNEFPESQHIVARIQAMLTAISTLRTTLRNARAVIESQMPESELRDNIMRQIHAAMADADVASMAITGETE